MYPQTHKKVVQWGLGHMHVLISNLFIYQVASGRAMADAGPDLPSKKGNIIGSAREMALGDRGQGSLHETSQVF